MRPKFSIIMPVYNASNYLIDAINSILNQSYLDFELLIADDCSTDGSKILIDAIDDNRIKTYHNKANIGYLRTCNKLFKLCKGELITFQDSDDWSSDNRLEELVSYFEANNDVDLVGSFSKHVNEEGTEVKIRTCPEKHEELIEVINHRNPFDGATICIRYIVYEKIGGYKLIYDRIGSEDYDWLTRISEQYKVACVPKPLYFVRRSKGSITRNITNPKQLFSHDFVQICKEQRNKMGKDASDSIELNSELEQYISKKINIYHTHPSLLLVRNAENAMYNGMFKEALSFSMKSIFMEPYRIINYRTFLYILRKANFKLFK